MIELIRLYCTNNGIPINLLTYHNTMEDVIKEIEDYLEENE